MRTVKGQLHHLGHYTEEKTSNISIAKPRNLWYVTMSKGVHVRVSVSDVRVWNMFERDRA